MHKPGRIGSHLMTLGLVLPLMGTVAAQEQPPESAAINVRLDQAKPGETVKLAAGTYTITEAIRMKSGVRLVGAGQGKTIVRFGGEKPDALLRIAGCEDAEIAHLTIDGEDNRLLLQGILGSNSRRPPRSRFPPMPAWAGAALVPPYVKVADRRRTTPGIARRPRPSAAPCRMTTRRRPSTRSGSHSAPAPTC